MDAVEWFIEEKEGDQQEVLQYLYQLFLSFPEVTSKIRYRIPFYYRKNWVCYTNPLKNNAVELVFIRGQELSNTQGLLQKKDRKMVAGLTFHKVGDIPEEALVEIIQEAFLIDDTKMTKKK